MTRLDHDVCMAAAKAVLDTVAHLLRPEEQREFFDAVFTTLEAALLRRDEMLARERRRLGKPSEI